MKKIYIFTILIEIIFLLNINSLNAVSVKKLELKVADENKIDHPAVRGLLKMAEIVKDSSKGRINMIVSHSKQLGTEQDTMELMLLGSVDIIRVKIDTMLTYVKELKVLTLPFIFKNDEHKWKVLNGAVGEELSGLSNSTNYLILGYYDAYPLNIYNKKKSIKVLSDLKDLNLRVKNEYSEELLKTYNAKPVLLSEKDYYNSIESIDGAEEDIFTYYSKGFYEFGKYYTLTGHYTAPEIIIISKKTWTKLSADDQSIIKNALKESLMFEQKIIKDSINDLIYKCQESGSEITTDINSESFTKNIDNIYKKIAPDLSNWIEKIKSVK